ncbi:MAG: hypothetical protein A2161_13195 [Candidatus Schekmanbacteria bacterium RBG_13_48_7]|uniref:AbiEi antitoxin N-terminal domain-containing protein n=1 Tax=Candidatus Schekmanbacteria bacterium RBG_13_48_7 TaxID=1817878 RepID=A0A1F7RY71_9BACT|nr:MAG: hypothetical protein A2161_13195 [Candidatus Schekmanbacteria bacterium RBG_13_48_7]
MKQRKSKLGFLEMQVLSYAQLRNKNIFVTGELKKVLGITAKQERELLSRMNRSGVMIRLKRGAYLVPLRIPSGGRWMASEHLVLAKLMEIYQATYQISGPNAFYFYSYDNQVPMRVYVYNNRIYGEKNIGGIEFVFIKTSVKRLGSVRDYLTPEGINTVMVTRSRALLDAVYDWSRYNTIPRAYTWILSSIANEPEIIQNLIQDTLKYGNKGTARRIGYLLTLYGTRNKQLNKLKSKIGSTKTFIPWFPGQDLRGKINREWGLIINGNLPE